MTDEQWEEMGFLAQRLYQSKKREQAQVNLIAMCHEGRLKPPRVFKSAEEWTRFQNSEKEFQKDYVDMQTTLQMIKDDIASLNYRLNALIPVYGQWFKVGEIFISKRDGWSIYSRVDVFSGDEDELPKL